jgi:type II secretion system protein N
MKDLIFGFFRFLRSIKFALLAFVASTAFFFVLFFPLNDLGDLVTTQVFKLTGGRVYFQFDSLRLSVFPPGLSMEKVMVESPQMPSIKSDALTISPSIGGALKGLPYGTVLADGFLKGQVNLSLSGAGKTESGAPRSLIELRAQKINLRELKSFLNTPFYLQGDLNIETKGVADLTFQEQPDIENVALVINQFEFPPGEVPTPAGPVSLPELKLKQIDLRGKLSNGTFTIENGKVGQATDELQVNLKGTIKVTFENRGGRVVPVIGAYNLDLDMRVQKSLRDKIALFLAFIEKHQKAPGEYKFKVASSMWGIPPQITTLR